MPAANSTANNKISKKIFSTWIVPPIKAKGIDPIKYGVKSLRFKLPAFM